MNPAHFWLILAPTEHVVRSIFIFAIFHDSESPNWSTDARNEDRQDRWMKKATNSYFQERKCKPAKTPNLMSSLELETCCSIEQDKGNR